jgi:hypothetical protein
MIRVLLDPAIPLVIVIVVSPSVLGIIVSPDVTVVAALVPTLEVIDDCVTLILVTASLSTQPEVSTTAST